MTSENPGFDTDSFREWLSNTAESTDSSEEEVFQQMMSSYWILTELTDLIDKSSSKKDTGSESTSEQNHGRGPTTDEGIAASDNPDTDSPDSSSVDSSLIELIKLLSETDARTPERTTSDDPLAVINALKHFGEANPTEPTPGRSNPDLVALINALSDFREADRTDSDSEGLGHDAIKHHVEALRENLDAVDTEVDGLTNDVEALFDDVDSLTDDVERLEGRIEEVDERHAEELEDVTDAIEDLKAKLEDVRSRTEQMAAAEEVNENFEKVRTILEHQLDRIDELDDNTTVLFDAYDELQPLLVDLEKRDRVADIKDTANRKGTDSATCDSCEETVDITLLESPNCPHCQQPFTDLIVNDGWLWTSYTLTQNDDSFGERATGDGILPTIDDPRVEQSDHSFKRVDADGEQSS